MINLTNPLEILGVIGGTAKVGYQSMVITSLSVDTVQDSATGQVELRSSVPNRPPIQGRIQILTNVDPSVTIEFQSLGFFKKIAISGAQRTTISNVFQALKADVEKGLVTLGLADGVQS